MVTSLAVWYDESLPICEWLGRVSVSGWRDVGWRANVIRDGSARNIRSGADPSWFLHVLLRDRERTVSVAPDTTVHRPYPEVDRLARLSAEPLGRRLPGVRHAP